jgi:hypothetical protein
MDYLAGSKEGEYDKHGYTDAQILSSRLKGHYTIWLYGITSLLFFFGSWIIAPFFLSRELACQITDLQWFRGLWPSNHQYFEILNYHTWSKINPCILAFSTSWGSLLGITLFIIRIISEIKSKTIFVVNLCIKLESIILFLMCIIMFIFAYFYAFDIEENKLATYSISSFSIYDGQFRPILYLSFVSFISYLGSVELLLLVFIGIRSKIEQK